MGSQGRSAGAGEGGFAEAVFHAVDVVGETRAALVAIGERETELAAVRAGREAGGGDANAANRTIPKLHLFEKEMSGLEDDFGGASGDAESTAGTDLAEVAEDYRDGELLRDLAALAKLPSEFIGGGAKGSLDTIACVGGGANFCLGGEGFAGSSGAERGGGSAPLIRVFGLGSFPEPPPPFPKGSFDGLDGEQGEVLGATDTHVGETFGAIRADLREEGNGKATYEIGSFVRGDRENPIGLGELGGEAGNGGIRTKPHGDSDADFGAESVAKLPGDIFRGSEEAFGAGKIERDGTILACSYGGAVVAADVQSTSPEVIIFVGVGCDDDELWTRMLSLPTRKAGMNTATKRLG
jgi:hypothetical protein